MSTHEEFTFSITALEAQRETLGDAVVDPAIIAMKAHLSLLKRDSAISQRKQITVLFADISGFTAMSEAMDAETVSLVMNDLWQKLDAVIQAEAGYIDKHIGDAVMALWSVDTAREDDPQRAIRAALAMQDILKRSTPMSRSVRLSMRIGINTGIALLGEVGTTGEFTAMGDTVNTASRLEHAAPVGEILISHSTYQLVRGIFEVTPKRALYVKGKTEPIKVYTVHRVRPLTFHIKMRGIQGIETRMIGRLSQLNQLQELFNNVIHGVQQQIAIISEAGLGKTRLLYEFENWLTTHPAMIVEFKARSRPETQEQPYALFRRLLSFHFQIEAIDSGNNLIKKIQERLEIILGVGNERQQQAYAISYLLGFDLTDQTIVSFTQDKARQIREQVLEVMVTYLTAVTDVNPAIILLEDIHWADRSSLEVITHLQKKLVDNRLLWVSLTRPSIFEYSPNWGKEVIQLSLPPLSDEEAHQLVQEILHKVEEIPPALPTLIVQNAGGNPFYIEELIRMLIEDGVIITSANQWVVNPTRLNEVRMPPTLTSLLQARLDSLSRHERLILQQAAVIGPTFWEAALNYLQLDNNPLSPKEITVALDALKERALIVSQQSVRLIQGDAFIFSNIVLHNVTYESILKQERKTYHAQIAQWLIEQSGEQTAEFASLIASHLERAEQPTQAAVYLRVAGEWAQKTSGFEEAVDFFKRALALLMASEQGERMGITKQIGKALYDMGNLSAAKKWALEYTEVSDVYSKAQAQLTQKLTKFAKTSTKKHWSQALSSLKSKANLNITDGQTDLEDNIETVSDDEATTSKSDTRAEDKEE